MLSSAENVLHPVVSRAWSYVESHHHVDDPADRHKHAEEQTEEDQGPSFPGCQLGLDEVSSAQGCSCLRWGEERVSK